MKYNAPASKFATRLLVHLSAIVIAVVLFPRHSLAIGFGASVFDATFAQDYPWAAGVITGGTLCTGEFVDPEWVLTAAHCVDGISSSTTVQAGDAVLTQATSLPVTEKFVHPDYSAGALQFDAALLHLENPFAVTPVQIATTSETSSLLTSGAAASIAGWGETATTTFPDRLQDGTAILDNLGFSGTLFSFDATGDSPRPCPGDSGGPLLLVGMDLLPRLVGTSSFSTGACGTDGSVYYTRTSDIQSFVDATLTPVPLPPAAWLFLSALCVLWGRPRPS